MKLAIWGTGGIYQLYKKSLKEENIVFLIDNNIEKQGSIIDNKLVFAPNKVDYSRLDYILIFTNAYEEKMQK